MRLRAAARAEVLTVLATLLAGLLSACGAHAPARARPPVSLRPDPRTGRALLRIAGQFNADYAANRAADVYSRWDAQSQTVIGRAAYIRRHRRCDTGSGPGVVQDAVHRGRWWLVHYSISGVQLTDYWSYQRGRWVFDLFRSNPQAVDLYRLPEARYLAAVGCAVRS